ncbi:uncharacterized protein LOC130653900 [Hydractinia symbiolongicarpus]|uniref:uncharacterized protein LOC130653900 n=1 Tax=Hydractinia symbiolongicarpus TaxID=13093 RepID=UPI00254C87B5|nr:uncharacterized protein LOC130653900 [Hydractinia symbiolongicarpus]
MVYPPYIDYPIGHNFRPKGILMDLTEQMLLTCAHNCTSFNQSVYISYNRVDLNSFSDIKNFTVNGTGLQMPRMDTGKYTYGYSHIAIVTTPGFVLLEVPDDAVEAATKAETKLFHGILDALPLCGLFILLNSLFGALFWFCEPTKVEHKGRGISIRGLFEGLYLAVMTSTTVGYGDKVPETTRGRAYIVIWTLLGLVLTGIVTGSLSSAMSVSVIASISQKFPEDKILALYGTSEYAYGKKNAKNFDTHTPYQSYEEVLSPLHQQSVKYALLDRYVAEALKLNISAYGLFVKKAFNVPTDFGVAAFGEMEKLKVCGRKFAADNTFVSDAAIAELLKKYSDIKTSKPSGNTPIDIISWQAKMYNYILKILLVLFLTFFVFGLIYEVFRRRRIKKLRGKVHTTLEIKEQLHRELKLLARNTIQEFRDMIERVDDLIEKLNYKHGKELLKMRTEMSKKYGVNFKYVRPSELGVPLEKILEYKEDLKNKPKETIFLKVRRFKVLVFGHLGRIFRLFR